MTAISKIKVQGARYHENLDQTAARWAARGAVETMSKTIAGNVVVITGESLGLGEATARLLSAQGASVVLGRSVGKRCLTVKR